MLLKGLADLGLVEFHDVSPVSSSDEEASAGCAGLVDELGFDMSLEVVVTDGFSIVHQFDLSFRITFHCRLTQLYIPGFVQENKRVVLLIVDLEAHLEFTVEEEVCLLNFLILIVDDLVFFNFYRFKLDHDHVHEPLV